MARDDSPRLEMLLGFATSKPCSRYASITVTQQRNKGALPLVYFPDLALSCQGWLVMRTAGQQCRDATRALGAGLVGHGNMPSALSFETMKSEGSGNEQSTK